MHKVAFTNDTETTIHIGSKSVTPGSTREVDPTMIPKKYESKAHNFIPGKKESAEPTSNPILEILDTNVASVLSAINEKNDEGAFNYSNEDLLKLQEAEENGNTRKGVMEGIAEEILSRAAEAQEVEELVSELSEMSDDDLTEALDLYAADEGKLALVQAEIDKR